MCFVPFSHYDYEDFAHLLLLVIHIYTCMAYLILEGM